MISWSFFRAPVEPEPTEKIFPCSPALTILLIRVSAWWKRPVRYFPE
jgi:hypothetical protein